MAHTEHPAEKPSQAYLVVLETALRDGDNDFACALLRDNGPFADERELADALVRAAHAAEASPDKALWYGGVELLYVHSQSNVVTPEAQEILRAAHTEARHFLDVYYRVGRGDDAPGELPADSIAETHDPTDPFAGLVEADDVIYGAAVDVEPYDPEGWDDDQFVPMASEEENSHFPVLAAAIEKAQRTKDLEGAITMIEERVGSGLAALFREVLDKYVYQFAEGMIKDRHNVAAATEIVENYASSPETAFQMRLSLDKLVMKEASNMITTYSSPGAARKVIEEGASAPARRDAMLLRLDLK